MKIRVDHTRRPSIADREPHIPHLQLTLSVPIEAEVTATSANSASLIRIIHGNELEALGTRPLGPQQLHSVLYKRPPVLSF